MVSRFSNMNSETIKSLDTLMKKHVKDKKILDVRTSKLTASGITGLLLQVDVTLGHTHGRLGQMHVVAKGISRKAYQQDMLSTKIRSKKEIEFYAKIVPILQDYQRERRVQCTIDFFPTFYAARSNLNGSANVDQNATIILENVLKSGYKKVNRSTGFDVDITRLIIKNLAIFHGVSLALRLSKPGIFQEKIEPHLTSTNHQLPLDLSEPKDELVDTIIEFLETQQEFQSTLPILKNLLKYHSGEKQQEEVKIFHTISHGDMEGNNVMIKFEGNKPVACKFLDFKNVALRSVTHDLLVLLLGNVQQKILEQHFNDLIKYYHDELFDNLQQLGCESISLSLERLLDEIKAEAREVLWQIVFKVIAKKETDLILLDLQKTLNVERKGNITPQAKTRLVFIIRKYIENEWL